jgi:hypothetical protein
MIAILLKLALGARKWATLGLAALRRFFGSLNAQGWIGLICCAGMAMIALHQWGEARHWKKQSGQFEKLYRADEASFAKIAAHAQAIKQKTDQLSASINKTIKEKNDAENARISATVDALRLRGPGKAACSGSASTPAVPGPAAAAPAINAGVDRLPDQGGQQLIALPFPDTLSFAAAFDRLRAEVAADREQREQLERIWPTSSANLRAAPDVAKSASKPDGDKTP